MSHRLQHVVEAAVPTWRQVTFRYVVVYTHKSDGWAIEFYWRKEGAAQGPASSPVRPSWWPFEDSQRWPTRSTAEVYVRELMPTAVLNLEV